MERRFSAAHSSRFFELGGVNVEHIIYMLHGFDSYTLIDLWEAELEIQHQRDPRITDIVAGAEYLPIDNHSIDRVKVTRSLHRIDHSEIVLQEINGALKSDGTGKILLSCDLESFVRFLRSLQLSELQRN